MRSRDKKHTVVVALSGGVDSAVTAALLVKAGYAVTAVFVINYEGKNAFGEDCYVHEYRDAVRVAAHLNIPILKWNFAKEYQKYVLEQMFSEYEAGRTPNPDVLCNKFVKFGSWLTKARELGFEYMATGHYAKKSEVLSRRHASLHPKSTEHFSLCIPKDTVKDQTYFLHQLNQEQLKYTLFPLADYTKPEVRKLAEKFKLPVAKKEESMGICFIGEVPMKDFLEQRIKKNPGNIVFSNGEVVGQHDGLPFYTIGQRHFGTQNSKSTARIQVEGNRPLYIVAKRAKTNELVVGYEDDLLMNTREITVENMHWISGQPPAFPLQCQVRLRHRQELQECRLDFRLQTSDFGPSVTVICKNPQRAVTPGQFAVVYKDGECLGGGVIS
jgi:tRNA-specific 2-thiouridylase